MPRGTKIDWATATWNPVTGCDKVSDGCTNCYAESIANRFAGTAQYPNGFDVTLKPDKLTEPDRWKAPERVFVNSMSDLFHADIPDEFIDQVWATMARNPRHTFMILTKRPGRMRSWVHQHGPAIPLPNVWLGVSVESQRWADVRIPTLLDTPAAVRFLSCEPLLAPLDLSRWLGIEHYDSFGWGEELAASLQGTVGTGRGLGWIIVGGESGQQARPMHPEWASDLRNQAQAAGVPFFYKQHGTWVPAPWEVPQRDGEPDLDYRRRARTEGATHTYHVDAHEHGHHPVAASTKPHERTPTPGVARIGMRRRRGKTTQPDMLDGETWHQFPDAREHV